MSKDEGDWGGLIEAVCDLLVELPLALWPFVISIVLLFVWWLNGGCG